MSLRLLAYRLNADLPCSTLNLFFIAYLVKAFFIPIFSDNLLCAQLLYSCVFLTDFNLVFSFFVNGLSLLYLNFLTVNYY